MAAGQRGEEEGRLAAEDSRGFVLTATTRRGESEEIRKSTFSLFPSISRPFFHIPEE